MAVTIRVQTGFASLDALVRSFHHFLLLIFSEVKHSSQNTVVKKWWTSYYGLFSLLARICNA